MLASVRPDLEGRSVTVREVLDEARRQLADGQFAKDPATESALALVMGHSYEGLGLYEDAVPLLRRSAELRQAAHGRNDPRTYASLYRLGTVLWKKGDLEESLQIREDLVEMAVTTSGLIHRDYAEALSNLANTKADMGDFAGAELHLREAVEIGRLLAVEAEGETEGQAQRDLGRFLNNYGTVLMDLERYAEAVTVFEEMLEIRARQEGPNSDVYAIGLVNLGSAQGSLGRLDDAEATLVQAVALNEAVHGPNHPRTGNAYAALATVLYKRGRYPESEEMARRALVVHLAASGEGYWRVAMLRQRIAEVIMMDGRLDEADALLTAAWNALEATQDPSSGWLQQVAASRSRLYERRGDDAAAAAWAARAADPRN
jgi:tetratricopeptide (TPR) repeat protein